MFITSLIVLLVLLATYWALYSWAWDRVMADVKPQNGAAHLWTCVGFGLSPNRMWFLTAIYVICAIFFLIAMGWISGALIGTCIFLCANHSIHHFNLIREHKPVKA